MPLDLDATLITAHSDKEDARPTYKRGFGHHPVMAFLDHGAGGSGEGLAAVLRPGNAGANNAADLLATLDLALAQLPAELTGRVLVRSDGGGYSHAFFAGVAERGLEFSIGWQANTDVADAIGLLPETAWTSAYDGDGEPREGADVAELTGLLALDGWPLGTRVIARREIPHPGAQLHLTDIEGRRVTCFATTSRGPLADTCNCANAVVRFTYGVPSCSDRTGPSTSPVCLAGQALPRIFRRVATPRPQPRRKDKARPNCAKSRG